jgi:paraquat-inducible protein A
MTLRASELGIARCRFCGQIEDFTMLTRCGRCGRRLALPHPLKSAQRSLAWLITAILLYFPANLLPVMYVSGIGGGGESTIMGGILEFWSSGSYGIALLIFGASVAVPITKFAALGLLITMTLRNSPGARTQRTRLYRFVEFIGYWSMLDVVVLALTCRLVRFDALAVAEPRAGIVFFCAVVLLTMVSALSFDERSIWLRRAAM